MHRICVGAFLNNIKRNFRQGIKNLKLKNLSLIHIISSFKIVPRGSPHLWGEVYWGVVQDLWIKNKFSSNLLKVSDGMCVALKKNIIEKLYRRCKPKNLIHAHELSSKNYKF